MIIEFNKMHGLGNDFMVIDATKKSIYLAPHQIVQLANRHTGVGFDQLLLLEAPRANDHDFFYRIFNANGQEVGQCGNGARCITLFVRLHQLSKKHELKFATNTSNIACNILADNQISVMMGLPHQIHDITVHYAHDILHLTTLDLGNPHAVLQVDDINNIPINSLGEQLQTHSQFPNGVNVGFMQIINEQQIKLRVFERGAGETLACGSGACAAMVVGRLQQLLSTSVTVELEGGSLVIEWPDLASPVWMTGPAVNVYSGKVEIN